MLCVCACVWVGGGGWARGKSEAVLGLRVITTRTIIVASQEDKYNNTLHQYNKCTCTRAINNTYFEPSYTSWLGLFSKLLPVTNDITN